MGAKVSPQIGTVPENFHTSPQKGLQFPGSRGGESCKTKNSKQCLKLIWNFPEGESLKKSLLWERYGYFLELHGCVKDDRTCACNIY